MKVRLGDVCEILNGFAFKSENYVSSGIRIIRIANVQKGYIEDTSPCFYPIEQKSNLSRYMLSEGDLLLSLTGNVGRVALLHKNMLPAALNQRVACLRLKRNDVLIKYLFHFMNGEKFEEDCIDSSKGIAQKNMSTEWLKEYVLDIPSFENQQEVICILDKISSIIDKRKRQLEKLDLLIKSQFIAMFGDIRREDTLINLCHFIDYRGKTPEKTNKGLPFITAKNIKMHYMSFDTQEFISRDTYNRVMTRGFPQEGDVVFTTEAPLGNVCRIPHFETEFYIGQRIITMQTTILEPAYLEYALASESFREKIAAKSSGSTVTGIRSKLLEKLTIPVPDRELQKKFSTVLAQTDELKSTIKRSLEKLETLKKALMQKYFG